MIEHERSYMFTHDGMHRFLEGLKIKLGDNFHLEDHYLDKGCRIREIRQMDEAGAPIDDEFRLTSKTGDKCDGHRFEDEADLSEEAASILIKQAKLRVSKDRYCITVPSDRPYDRPYNITVDFVYHPMKVAFLEVEACEPISIPIPRDIDRTLFGVDLVESTLCTWDYFNRKIAFCGGPSSGKTETAKWLSHAINTRFTGNAFHVTEYATSFIQKYRRKPEFADQIMMLYGQRKRERDASTAGFVVSDCPTFLNFIYAQLLYDMPFCEKSALQLAKIYKEVLFDVPTYDDIILLEIQEYSENNIRYQSKEEALQVQARIRAFLDDHNISYRVATYECADLILNELLYLNEVDHGTK